MNKLTKLMLASAMMITSGFAMEGTVSILSGSNPINEGGIETIANNDVVLTGSMTLATSDTAANVAQLIVDEGRTFEVRSGTLSKSGTGSNDAKITLKGTLKITEADPGEGGTPVAPNVDLLDVAVEGGRTVTYVIEDGFVGDIILTNINMSGGNTLDDGTLGTGTCDNGYVIMWEGDYWVSGPTGKQSDLTFVCLSGSSRWAKVSGNDNVIYDLSNITDGYVGRYKRTVKRMSAGGVIDVRALRSYDVGSKDVVDYSAKVRNISPTSLAEFKLPFNCQFSAVNLSDVVTVTYDVLKIGEQSAADIVEGVIKRVVTEAAGTYGDYKNDGSLGVTTTAAGTEHSVDGNIKNINLSEVVSDTSLNVPNVKLDTDDLDSSSMEIDSETTYNFGLGGTNDISVTKSESAAEGTKLVLAGDNSTYNPSDKTKVVMPDIVEFAASNSLLPFSFKYGKGIFTGATNTNSIASGVTVEFTNGMELAAGTTLTVNGSLTL